MNVSRSLALTMALCTAVGGALALPATAASSTHASRGAVASMRVLDDNTAVLRFDGVGTGAHRVFALENPSRVVVDLNGASLAQEQAAKLSGFALVSRTELSAFEGTGGAVQRVILSVKNDVTAEGRQDGDAFVVSLKKHAAGVTPVVELTGAGEAQAASRLLGVDVGDRHGRTLVSLKTDGQVSRYEVEEVENPPRLVVDLYGVKAKRGLDRRYKSTVGRVRVGLHHNKTRIVLDAKGKAFPRYDVATTGDGVKLVFDSSVTTTKSTGAIGALTVQDKDGFARMRIPTKGKVRVRTLASSPTSRTVLLEGATADAAHATTKRFDRGALSAVRVEPVDGGVKVSATFRDAVENSLWQGEGALFWDYRTGVRKASAVQPAAAAYSATAATATAQEVTPARRFRGRKITVDLMEADILNVLRLISDVSGRNIVVAQEVQGKVTIKLKNVPWDQALDVILRVNKLAMDSRGGVIRVITAEQKAKELEQAASIRENRMKSVPNVTRLIPVNYSLAKDLVPTIKGLLTPNRGTVAFDERTNVIIVNDLREVLDKAEMLVRSLDSQTPQILIEARMVEAGSRFSRALGIQWGGGVNMSEVKGNPTGLYFPNNVGLAGGATPRQELLQANGGEYGPSNYAVNAPAPGDQTTALGMHLGTIGNMAYLNARLTAAQSSNEVRVVSAPRVTTMDNKKAMVMQGQRVPVIINNGVQGITTQFVNAALSLEVTPHVTADGSILMALSVTNNTLGSPTATGLPPVNTKVVETEMLVKDGDTAVIGGIFQDRHAESFRGTPFLADIPLLGWLFKSSSYEEERREMLVFLTPRIVNRRAATVTGTVVE